MSAIDLRSLSHIKGCGVVLIVWSVYYRIVTQVGYFVTATFYLYYIVSKKLIVLSFRSGQGQLSSKRLSLVEMFIDKTVFWYTPPGFQC